MIVDDFKLEISNSQVYSIIGVRGIGKTTLLREIIHDFKQDDDWIVIELNSQRDMLKSLASTLYNVPELTVLFKEAQYNFSLFGIGLSNKDVAPISDIETILELMIDKVRYLDKHVLVCVYEVSNTSSMREFAAAFCSPTF